MSKVYTGLKVGVGVACLYEAVAIGFDLAGSHVPPTISHEVGIAPWLGPLILGGLALHFYWSHVWPWLKRVLRL